MRLLETSAITRYLDDVLPGKSLIPQAAKDRARMDMAIGIIDSYGYGALVGGVAAYHLFPDFVGGKNDAMRQAGMETGRKVIERPQEVRCGSRSAVGARLIILGRGLWPIVSPRWGKQALKWVRTRRDGTASTKSSPARLVRLHPRPRMC
jgi:glutathione S-transferase